MELVHLSRDAIPRPTLGATLRAARLGRNITLETVAAHTKINLGFFRDLERDDLSKWPANQFYRESYLRGYAQAVGLDPVEVVDAFRREFVPAGTSGATATATQRRLTPVTIPVIIAITFVALYSLARWTTAVQRDPAAGVSASSVAPPAVVESTTPPPNEVPTAEPVAPPPDAPATADLDQIEGELMITSTPPGARVLVNGIGIGPTPARARFLPPGSYTVRFLLPGHSSAIRNAEISPTRLRAHVSARLEPAPLQRAQVPAEPSAPAVDRSGDQ
jgi:cytoskeleton protein RodZ